MATPKLFSKLKDITTNIETTTILATNALPKAGGEISGDLSVSGELTGELSGNASTATKLANAGVITLAGDVSGNVAFDGSDTTLTVTVTDDSHSHTIANIDNLQTTLDAKAPLASPALTGIPTAPTAAEDTNTTQIATTAFVKTAIANKTSISGNAETATKLAESKTITLSGDASGSVDFDGSQDVTLTVTVADDSHSHTIANIDNLETTLSTKANLASPTFTGTPKAPTATDGTNTTQIATTAFVTSAVANKTSITGNAGTATKLAESKTITLSGDVSGSVDFDGSQDVTLTVTVADDSHSHTIANIDNLQTTLDAKAPLASPAFTGTPTAPTAATSTNTTQIATTAFVQALVDSKIAAADAMIYKGTIGTGGTVTALPNTHSTGWTYKVVTAGTYAGVKCNVGDMIVCLTDGTAANNADWTVIEGNIDGAVTGPTSAVAGQIAVFDGTTGKVIKDSGFTIAKSVPSDAKFTDTNTTYTGSDGITLTGTNFTNSGVRSISSGSTNGTISVNTNGTAADVSVGGLKSAAFTESSDYAASSHTSVTANGSILGHVKLSDVTNSTSGVSDGLAATPSAVKSAYDLANAALPKSGGNMTGSISYDDTLEFGIGYFSSANMRLYGSNYSSEYYRGSVKLESKCSGKNTLSLEFNPSNQEVKLGHLTTNLLQFSNNETYQSAELKSFNTKLKLDGKNNKVELGDSYNTRIELNGGDNNKVAIKGTNEVKLESDKKIIIGSENHRAGITVYNEEDRVNICETYRGSSIELVGCKSDSATKYIELLAYADMKITKIRIDGNERKITLDASTVEFTGTPKAPTATAGTNTTQIATTAFVNTAIANKTSISGNAATATKLASAGTITLAGDASGSVAFDGSDATLTVTVADDSHNHTIANVDNLQTTLNAKAPLASPTFTGTPAAPTATAGTNTTQIATTAFVTSAVSTKANTVDVVALTGNQTIAGTKTFSSTIAGSINGNAATATKLKTARTIDGVSFDGSGNILHYGTCDTAAATAAKTVTLANFKLDTGSRVMVKFTITNTAANPTLNVNSTGAKSIMYRGAAITAGYLAANRVYEFVYDGTNYELVGDINTDTNNKVTQTITTTNAEYALLAMADAAATATKTNGARFASAVTLNPSSGTITATTFKGALDGNAATATTASACSGNAATATKATKDSAGQQINTTYIKGLSVSGKTITYTKGDGTTGTITTQDTNTTYSNMTAATADAAGKAGLVPAPGAGKQTSFLRGDGTWVVPTNTDTKVTQTVSTTNNTYPILACATANATATTTTTAIFASAIKINPSAGSLTATAVYNAVWNDYAEFFPRGEETEAGDFIALSLDSDNEVYMKASKETSKSVGIHSDSFGHLIGGEDAPDGEDFVEYNLPRFIPVGLVGRVKAKIVGEIKKGDFVVISDIPGVGRKFDKELDSCMDIIGMACESSDDKDIKRIKVKLGN